VVIIGGFAGIALAKKLKNKKKVQVVLLDATNHHTFQPLLYQVAWWIEAIHCLSYSKVISRI
jgi:NADH dehydrogenase